MGMQEGRCLGGVGEHGPKQLVVRSLDVVVHRLSKRSRGHWRFRGRSRPDPIEISRY